MLTTLTVNHLHYKNIVSKIIGKILPNKIRVEIRQAGDIRIKCIEYTDRKGRVNWQKLDKIIGAQRNRLLCDVSVSLPKELGYKRFEDSEYKSRLCTNLAISLLCAFSKDNLSVGLIDNDANFVTLPRYLLEHTENLVVVTKRGDVYSKVEKELLLEMGAPLRISKSTDSLSKCDIIIAPEYGGETLFCEDSCLVLKTKKEKSDEGTTVLYDYFIRLPKKLSDICPESLEDTYFAAALYSIGYRYELGSFVPSICESENSMHTFSSLKKLISKVDAKT